MTTFRWNNPAGESDPARVQRDLSPVMLSDSETARLRNIAKKKRRKAAKEASALRKIGTIKKAAAAEKAAAIREAAAIQKAADRRKAKALQQAEALKKAAARRAAAAPKKVVIPEKVAALNAALLKVGRPKKTIAKLKPSKTAPAGNARLMAKIAGSPQPTPSDAELEALRKSLVRRRKKEGPRPPPVVEVRKRTPLQP